eukprot:118240-Alexandrium_andersonii.AAC.1
MAVVSSKGAGLALLPGPVALKPFVDSGFMHRSYLVDFSVYLKAVLIRCFTFLRALLDALPARGIRHL